jgi:hypothetical protein
VVCGAGREVVMSLWVNGLRRWKAKRFGRAARGGRCSVKWLKPLSFNNLSELPPTAWAGSSPAAGAFSALVFQRDTESVVCGGVRRWG